MQNYPIDSITVAEIIKRHRAETTDLEDQLALVTRHNDMLLDKVNKLQAACDELQGILEATHDCNENEFIYFSYQDKTKRTDTL